MKDMSLSRQRATDLVTAYNHSLEQQIVGRGSSLVCRDEELWKDVEELLLEGDAQETHCLGLDPLRVMEESLKAAAAGRVKARGGLQGLAKAFEVVEQAALNLYLGPWREEYKVVKMYSGMFTHYIKPVLSMPQIEKLFGLLGYQPGSSRQEQLRLQSTRAGPSPSPGDLLRLSCAFFLCRCECRLLLVALGKHAGEVQWELSMVRERQRGSNLQVALDNTKKALEVHKPLMKPFDGDVEEDLYTDDQVNGGQKAVVANDDEGPRSLTWGTPSPQAAKAHSNGVTLLSSSTTREDVCISKFKYQLTKASPLEPEATRSFSGRSACEESTFDKEDSQSLSLQEEALGLQADAYHMCGCLQSPHVSLKLCTDCNILHNITCALLNCCYKENHYVVRYDSTAGSPPAGSLGPSDVNTSPTLTSSSAAMSSLVLHDDDPKSISPSLHHPITYHECCDLTQLDPEVACLSCGVFHSGSCREIEFCQSHHDIKPLGVCSCGSKCSRSPLVLCRYCANEYCRPCWYRSPVMCICGQTFDQGSSV